MLRASHLSQDEAICPVNGHLSRGCTMIRVAFWNLQEGISDDNYINTTCIKYSEKKRRLLRSV
jgi:hypothetical protein